jgi:hypothetical protein
MRGCFGRTFSLGAKYMSTRTNVGTVWPFKTLTVIPFSFYLEMLHSDAFLIEICRSVNNDGGRMLRGGINRPGKILTSCLLFERALFQHTIGTSYLLLQICPWITLLTFSYQETTRLACLHPIKLASPACYPAVRLKEPPRYIKR